MKNKKRVIPCLDVKDGRVIKGVNFVDFKDVGDPAEQAEYYDRVGADAIVFLDITATTENRDTIIDLAQQVAARIIAPFTIGGGIRTEQDAARIFDAGASRVSVNSAAVKRPLLINEIAGRFGGQRLTVAIDAQRKNGGYTVLINGGTTDTGIDAVEWAKEAVNRGCSEILLTSKDRDGMKNGYDIEITRAIADAVNVPVIASGGAGKLSDFYDALTDGGAEAVLAASLFHFRTLEIKDVKSYLRERGLSVYGNE